jgi:hypothetical protein
MAKKTKKHGNAGNDHALRGDYSADLTIRLTEDQDEHIITKAKATKTSRSGVVRQLIDDDMKQDKNK